MTRPMLSVAVLLLAACSGGKDDDGPEATATIGMCGSDGVRTARIPSDTYTRGLIRTRYFMIGTADSPCQG